MGSVHNLRDNTGTPPPEPPMEARIAKLEVSVDYIQRDISELKTDTRLIREEMTSLRKDMGADFRLLFWTIITVALGLSGLMAKGFGWL